MHSEHLRNVQWSWTAFGWFAAVAASSAILLAMESVGLLGRSESADALWVTFAVVLGFAFGGFVAGYKAAAAPILHGAAMAGASFVAWFLINLTFGGFTTGLSAWEHLSVRTAALALLVQGGAAIAGCWLGYRYAPLRVE